MSKLLPKKGRPYAAVALGVALFLAGYTQGRTPAPAPIPTNVSAPAATQTGAAQAPRIDYPTRPVELVVPFGAGGAADVAARKLSAVVEKDLGQAISISNVTGAGGAAAYQRVKNAKPDGYSLLWTSAAMATLPTQGNIDFDYKAFDHIAMVSTETVTLAVAADSPYKSLKDFLDESKKRGEAKPMTVGNSGVGSFTHLSAVAIADKAQAPFTHIAFGTGLAVTNLIGGHIDASVQHPAEILPMVKNNQVRMLSVSSNKRIEAFKDVPTLKEQGIDLELVQFRGVSAPKGTPKPILDRLETAFLKAADSQEWKDQSAQAGSETIKMKGAELTKFLGDQHVQIAELAKNVKPEQTKK